MFNSSTSIEKKRSEIFNKVNKKILMMINWTMKLIVTPKTYNI